MFSFSSSWNCFFLKYFLKSNVRPSGSGGFLCGTGFHYRFNSLIVTWLVIFFCFFLCQFSKLNFSNSHEILHTLLLPSLNVCGIWSPVLFPLFLILGVSLSLNSLCQGEGPYQRNFWLCCTFYPISIVLNYFLISTFLNFSFYWPFERDRECFSYF